MNRFGHRFLFLPALLLCLLLGVSPVYAQTDCLVQAEIPASECQALLDLYNSTNGPGWTANAGWNLDNFPCAWTGISCSGGQVTNLFMFNNQLSGPLPASIGDLTALDVLNLQSNMLTGPIPASIGNIAGMNSLRLSNNMLTGPIPASISNMTGLVSLVLQDNQLDGTIPVSLSLLNPETIRLDANLLTGSIPPELGVMNLVQTLRLDDNQLTGPIPPEIGNMTSLITLRLDVNQLTGTVPLPVAEVGAAALAGCDMTGNTPSLCMPDTPDYQILGDPICGLPLDANCQPLPVELTSFTAHADGNAVVLRWQTASETDNAGFEVQHRDAAGGDWQPLDFIDGAGTTTRPQHYTYQTSPLEPGTYTFRLRQVDLDGTFAYSPVVEVVLAVPNGMRLSVPFPNPAATDTHIAYSQSTTGPLTLAVYDAVGRRVHTVHEGTLGGGHSHRFVLPVASWPVGVYFVRASGPNGQQSRALHLVR